MVLEAKMAEVPRRKFRRRAEKTYPEIKGDPWMEVKLKEDGKSKKYSVTVAMRSLPDEETADAVFDKGRRLFIAMLEKFAVGEKI